MRRTFSVLALTAILAGCAAGPDYRPPETTTLVPQAYHNAAEQGATADLASWWQAFNDPQLTILVDHALTANLDIAQAAARLKQARAALIQSRADLLPSISASGGAGRDFAEGRPDGSSYSLGADARWTVDLFGGARRAVEASRAELEAAGYDLAAVRTAIAAEVALNYIALREAEMRLAIARDVLATQEENLEIAGWRVQAGLVSSLDVERARTQRAQTAAAIPALETTIAAARHRLAVLLATAPGGLGIATADGIPQAAPDLALGIPADLLRRRPDLRSAERDLAAASARIGVAKARLFPALTISGDVGTSALRLGSLGDVVTGGLFASLGQILFDGGARAAQLRASRAVAEAALASYRRNVLGALEDVENALVALEAARERQRLIAVSRDSAETSALLARSQYRAGLTDFQTLLDAERQLLGARDSYASARADEANALVRLYVALGGGWDANGKQS